MRGEVYRPRTGKSSRAVCLRAAPGIFANFAMITSGNRIDMKVKSTAWKFSRSIFVSMEDITAQRNVVFDLLAVASGLALAIVAMLFWCVEIYAGQDLPIWFYLLGMVGMTAATYAQLQQARGDDHA